jgi:CRISPR type III-B/RAMP module RAMP protein Cmr6
MNVHYPDYYQKEKTPGDWMEPTPVVFLTVENAEYQFSVASKKADFAEKLQLHSKKPSKR